MFCKPLSSVFSSHWIWVYVTSLIQQHSNLYSGTCLLIYLGHGSSTLLKPLLHLFRPKPLEYALALFYFPHLISSIYSVNTYIFSPYYASGSGILQGIYQKILLIPVSTYMCNLTTLTISTSCSTLDYYKDHLTGLPDSALALSTYAKLILYMGARIIF